MKIQERKVLLACRCTLLAVICVLCGFLFININAEAETVRIGTVSGLTSGGLNFRNSPGTSGTTVIATLYNGDSGTILAEKTVSGTVWYQMNVNGTVGWASSQYVTVSTKEITSSQDFEAHLTAQGFPESYKAQLRALHAQYPNWVFEAHHVNLTWDEVVKAQNSNHRSLVHTNSISSWKSLEGNDYNWSTGVWTGYDTAAWVGASEGIIKYHLDPRNFLDSTYVFQFLKQSYDANIDYSVGLKTMVANSFLAGSFTEDGVSKSYITTLIEAGKQSGVSPYTIAATLIQEQGRNGTSGLISGTYPGYEGYYNYYNIGAYQSGDLNPVQMGLIYAQKTDETTLRPWNTRTKAITGGSIKYGRDYVNIGQDTLYLKKFDLVPNASGGGLYNHQYMTNIQAAASEGKLLAGGYDASARAVALRFKIPVFKNMPATPATKPTENGKPYQLLQSISVTNGVFEPAYNIYQKKYRVTVPINTTSITINAISKNSNATVTGAGTITLDKDITKVTITVTIPNVSSNTYTLTISKGNPGKWIQNSIGWWYQYEDGYYPVNKWEYISGEWYYFNAQGYMVTGWKMIDGKWYYLKSSGARLTGWLEDGESTYYFDENGVMLTGWQTIDGKKYFFNENGVLDFVVEGQWLQNSIGRWYQYEDGSYPVSEWKYIEGEWYYFNAQGYMVTGWRLIDNKWYFLKSNGVRATGWLQQEDKTYYLDSNGVMLTGWQIVEGQKYLFDENGVMQIGWQEVGAKKCYLNEKGAMVIGWFVIEETKYYFGTDGYMKTGWLQLNGGKYYLQSNGALLTGWYEVEGEKYCSDNNGKLLIGWQMVGKKWYYFRTSGAMATDWLLLGSTWYYLHEDGVMATGWQQIRGTWYYFHGGGVMATGWVKINSTWYYFNDSGAMATGWKLISKKWYYFNESGAMTTGWLNDRGTWYYLDSSGAMVTNRYVDGYYLNSKGVWIP